MMVGLGEAAMRKQVLPLASLLCLCICLILNPLTAASQKIETVNGVRIIDNEKGGVWKGQPKVRLTLVQAIGGIEAKDPELAFNQIYDVVLDSAGNIYVLETGNNRIQKLDAQGKFLQTIGRQGQGPGDFQSAFSLDIDPRDILYVADARNQRIQMMEADGRVLRVIKLEEPGIFLIRHLPGRLIAKAGVRRPRELSGRVPPLIEIIDLDGKTKKSFGEAADFKEAATNFNSNRIGLDTDRAGNILLGFVYQNRIEKYSSDGKLLWKASRPLNYGTDVGKKGVELNFVSMGIAADGKGRVWANTFNRQMAPEEQSISISGRILTKQGKIAKMDIHKLEIFDPDGILLGEIPLNHLAHGHRIFGDTLFIWEVENEIVYQYKIEEIN